ncbi:MAG: BlaI/MecI/CopY family transcriptional regulator [Lachnospiraceae bacterium]|nr:BlaI/MecI/CopY family transcriptional regulator [Lachnospiraceae bacterium]
MPNEERRLGAVESKFADLIWENEPISSGDLVRLAEKTLGWKKSTTYTVLKKLSERGIFENADGTVTSKLSKEAFFAEKSEQFVTETFGGSLPAFVAAFLSQKPLSEEEADEIRRMIDRFRKEG